MAIMKKHLRFFSFGVLAFAMLSTVGTSAEEASKEELRSLDDQEQEIKKIAAVIKKDFKDKYS